jgi:hypothetical protein
VRRFSLAKPRENPAKRPFTTATGVDIILAVTVSGLRNRLPIANQWTRIRYSEDEVQVRSSPAARRNAVWGRKSSGLRERFKVEFRSGIMAGTDSIQLTVGGTGEVFLLPDLRHRLKCSVPLAWLLGVLRNAGTRKSVFAPRKHVFSRSEERLSAEVVLPSSPSRRTVGTRNS